MAAVGPHLSPGWRCEVVLSREMLCQGCQEDVPALVTNRRRLISKQDRLDIAGLPPVLLQKLPHKLPAGPVIGRLHQVRSEVRDVMGR
jgi:hypothetical protein